MLSLHLSRQNSHHIPNNRDALIKSDFPEQINSTASAPSEGAYDKGLDVLSSLSEFGFHIGYHCVFIRIRLQSAKFSRILLCSVGQRSGRGSRETRMKPKRRNAPTARVIQEFQVV
jgi:hypothetical protein